VAVRGLRGKEGESLINYGIGLVAAAIRLVRGEFGIARQLIERDALAGVAILSVALAVSALLRLKKSGSHRLKLQDEAIDSVPRYK
jgi:hypothetical protein